MTKRLPKIKILERNLRDYYGWAQTDKRVIAIKKGVNQRVYLGTLIHEILHCLYPEDSEATIYNNAAVITKYIWDKKYRRIDK